MCMIAGYIGHRNAVDVLTEMIRRQEFIFGGFYTGMATIEHGRLRRERIVGPLRELEASGRLRRLSGMIGIAHSRTNDGGGIAWSQPRFDDRDSIASVGMGVGGILGSADLSRQVAAALSDEGAVFQTRSVGGKLNGVELPDGDIVHSGEVALFALARGYRRQGSLRRALTSLNLRSESVNVYLIESEPARLYVVNQNQRLVISRNGNEVFLSSSMLGFPSATNWTCEVPPNTLATVSGKEITFEPLWEDEARFDFSIPAEAGRTFLDYVRSTPGTSWHEAVCNSLGPILPSGRATMSHILGHWVLEALLKENKIRMEIANVVGRDGQQDVPQARLFPV